LKLKENKNMNEEKEEVENVERVAVARKANRVEVPPQVMAFAAKCILARMEKEKADPSYLETARRGCEPVMQI
jgi:hypothetical protein